MRLGSDRSRDTLLNQRHRVAQNLDARRRLEALLGQIAAESAGARHRMSSQRRKLRGSLALFEASSALAETALNPSPGGSISPFCEPPTVTSTPQSS